MMFPLGDFVEAGRGHLSPSSGVRPFRDLQISSLDAPEGEGGRFSAWF